MFRITFFAGATWSDKKLVKRHVSVIRVETLSGGRHEIFCAQNYLFVLKYLK